MKKVFKHSGETFSAVSAAQKWAKENGYTVGSMCYAEPIGLAKASEYNHIAKWHNLSAADKAKLSGTITVCSKGYRKGDITITIND